MNGDVPDHREIWETVNSLRMDVSELKGMLTMHFKDGEHHHPPCKAAADVQKTMLSAVGAAVLALMAAMGTMILEFLRR